MQKIEALQIKPFMRLHGDQTLKKCMIIYMEMVVNLCPSQQVLTGIED